MKSDDSLLSAALLSLSIQIPTSDSPSPPPGLTKPSLVVPISVSDLTARSPFEGAAAESQSLFSDNSNFRHPNPLPAGLPPFPSSPRGSSDWPMTPEPQSLFTSGKQKDAGSCFIPVLFIILLSVNSQ